MIRHLHSALLLSTLLLVSSASLSAQTSNDAPAIGGYSPVSYFTANEAQIGDPRFAVTHEGQTYFLTSPEQVELFAKNPDRYRPRHSACSYSLAYGMVLPLDPTKFKIVSDSLLLFHRSEKKDARLEWNSGPLDEEELIARADANLFRIRF